MMRATAKRILNLSAALALAGAASACSDGGSARAGTAAGPSTSASATWADYAKCMREHGIDMPDPQPGGTISFGTQAKRDPAKLDAAMTACRSALPAGKGSAPLSAADQQSEVRRAQCLREHGVPVQDPQPGQNLTITGSRLDPAAVQAAIAACKGGS